MKEQPKDELAKVAEETEIAIQNEAPMGFGDDDGMDDIIIPRVKVIQTLSPERKEKLAEEGDIINSLTKDKLNGKVFIPVFKFNNNIWWRERADGGGIQCMARDGKHGSTSTGEPLICAICRKNEFDNTKQGREAIPVCTKYINFFGFIAGEKLPMIMSFAKTNYNEGKRMYSLAKVTMQNMWNHGYSLSEKLVSKAGNEWYIINPLANGVTSPEDRAYAIELYKSFYSNWNNINFDMDDNTVEAAATPASDIKSEF
jgi:hypothetical protein